MKFLIYSLFLVGGSMIAAPAVLPTTWYQQSFGSGPYLLNSPIATVPLANDCWSWSATEQLLAPQPQAIPISGVQPNRPNKWATITDITLSVRGGGNPDGFLVRDGNSGRVLTFGAFTVTSAGGVADIHLQTPIALDPTGANPPVIELLGDRSNLNSSLPPITNVGLLYAVNVLGRYVRNQ